MQVKLAQDPTIFMLIDMRELDPSNELLISLLEASDTDVIYGVTGRIVEPVFLDWRAIGSTPLKQWSFKIIRHLKLDRFEASKVLLVDDLVNIVRCRLVKVHQIELGRRRPLKSLCVLALALLTE